MKKTVKLEKHAEILDQLHKMVLKQAEAQDKVTGDVKDLTAVSVDAKNDKVDKEKEGSPEKAEQGYKQEGAKDPATPEAVSASGAKTAALGSEILNLLKKESEAQDKVTGDVKDLTAVSVDPKNDTVDKEKEGSPEKAEQGYKQEAAKDPATPEAVSVGGAKEASAKEIEKIADAVRSFELGRQFAAAIIKQANAASETELMKEAGRRDFDALIAQAAEELQVQEQQQKQAEYEGALYFDALVKAAADEAAAEEAKTQETVKEASAVEKKEDPKEDEAKKEAALNEKLASLRKDIVADVISALKAEVVEKK